MKNPSITPGCTGAAFIMRKARRLKRLLTAVSLCTLLTAAAVCRPVQAQPAETLKQPVHNLLENKGCQEYSIQKEQYLVEYSDTYDYWDVLTIEYPRLEIPATAVQETLNAALYDMAMDRVNYWHLNPDADVRAFQEEYFSVYADDVRCDIPFHSQFLASVHFRELYATGYPIYMVKYTERALNMDLSDGQIYALPDIFRIDAAFIDLWMQAAAARYGDIFTSEEDTDILLGWFTNTDTELKDYYICRPFFYLTEEKDFVIGISLDPLTTAAVTSENQNNTFSAWLSAAELEPFRTDSGFWEKYGRSVPAGYVVPCETLYNNIWLGKEASAWSF